MLSTNVRAVAASLLGLAAGCFADPSKVGSGSATGGTSQGSTSQASGTTTTTGMGSITTTSAPTTTAGTTITTSPPTTTSPTTTVGPGTTTTGPATTSIGPGTTASSTTGPNCDIDQYEPDDTATFAWYLGSIDDLDSDGGSVSAVLAGSDDIDWFTYDGTDSYFTVDPTRTLTTDGSVTLCKYAQCSSTGLAPDVTCPNGTTSDTSDELAGYDGCCGTDSGGFTIDINCGGNESAAVYIRLTTTEAACVNYTLDYHF